MDTAAVIKSSTVGWGWMGTIITPHRPHSSSTDSRIIQCTNLIVVRPSITLLHVSSNETKTTRTFEKNERKKRMNKLVKSTVDNSTSTTKVIHWDRRKCVSHIWYSRRFRILPSSCSCNVVDSRFHERIVYSFVFRSFYSTSSRFSLSRWNAV